MIQSFFQFTSDFISTYPRSLSFLAPIIGGENGVIFLSFLAKSGVVSVYIVFLFSFLGMLTIDSLWFFIPKTKLYKKITSGKTISRQHKKIEKKLEGLSHGNDILLLMLSKIVVGSRILVIIFVSTKKMKYRKFLSVILLPNLIWGASLVFVGFLARGGYEATIGVFNNIQIGILFLILFIFGIYYLMKKINKSIVEN
jgi:membrane protein DedA with SNARE-associated domain